ncbi:MAG TPA: SDR family oxidoreductase [Jatrophihabitans sp.]|jgi:short-subunit dehydrogenase|uniref:SDR family NAD(P)-dependent oxidoreductase n=1 Tax=Jatrophihabitans sp. TaxID=1932789 RepID=UPI002F059EED
MAVLDLTGKTVIVTGASSGIGEATARALHAAGALPVLAARRADRLRELSEQLGGALAAPTDVTDPAARHALIQATLDRHGRIDGLVNNAGAGILKLLVDTEPEEFSQLLELNLVSALAMTQAVLPAMREQGGGRIVNVSSGVIQTPAPTVSAYAASKAGLAMMSAVARVELAADGVEVSTVFPSLTATEFAGGIYQLGTEPFPGFVVHSTGYVAQVILRALRTGEASIDIPHGAEQPELIETPVG